MCVAACNCVCCSHDQLQKTEPEGLMTTRVLREAVSFADSNKPKIGESRGVIKRIITLVVPNATIFYWPQTERRFGLGVGADP